MAFGRVVACRLRVTNLLARRSGSAPSLDATTMATVKASDDPPLFARGEPNKSGMSANVAQPGPKGLDTAKTLVPPPATESIPLEAAPTNPQTIGLPSKVGQLFAALRSEPRLPKFKTTAGPLVDTAPILKPGESGIDVNQHKPFSTNPNPAPSASVPQQDTNDVPRLSALQSQQPNHTVSTSSSIGSPENTVSGHESSPHKQQLRKADLFAVLRAQPVTSTGKAAGVAPTSGGPCQEVEAHGLAAQPKLEDTPVNVAELLAALESAAQSGKPTAAGPNGGASSQNPPSATAALPLVEATVSVSQGSAASPMLGLSTARQGQSLSDSSIRSSETQKSTVPSPATQSPAASVGQLFAALRSPRPSLASKLVMSASSPPSLPLPRPHTQDATTIRKQDDPEPAMTAQRVVALDSVAKDSGDVHPASKPLQLFAALRSKTEPSQPSLRDHSQLNASVSSQPSVRDHSQPNASVSSQPSRPQIHLKAPKPSTVLPPKPVAKLPKKPSRRPLTGSSKMELSPANIAVLLSIPLGVYS